ncbi:MAG: heparinase II/III family protein, partial [Gammaproteobacteria bacterium]|nr:heparinase II/III family protein [Gammaproteobacteria bacterium]
MDSRVTPLSRARLLFNTVRYLSPVQIFGRVWLRASRPRPDTRPAPALRPPLKSWIAGPARERITGDCRRFRFLNVEGELSGPEGWNDPAREKLWLYNLHYFDCLRPGTMDGAPGQAQSAMIGRWIDENPPAGGNGWEPYPLSLRIVNWIIWHLSGNALDGDAIHSLAVQVRYLAKRLEWHLLGNHLFANAKALVFAGMFFEGEEAEAWLGKGLRILGEQVPEQVLGDGGHFELSPMYHGIILEDFLGLVNLAGVYGLVGERQSSSDAAVAESGGALSCGPGLNPGFRRATSRLRLLVNPAGAVSGWIDAVQSMRRWLGVMCHPDGGIPFFNDAAFGIAPDRDALEDYARRLGLGEISDELSGAVVALRDSGYVRLARGPVVALLDVGKIGPDYLPGHAHADSLGFELSFGNRRIIVNSGTSCYGVSDERHRQRSTAAHNTV